MFLEREKAAKVAPDGLSWSSASMPHLNGPTAPSWAQPCPRVARRASPVLFLIVVLAGPCQVRAQEVHYSPEERLDTIDVELISTAKRSIDFASYALTDRTVIDALDAADRRGVAIRIVLDPRERHDFVALGDLADNVRLKRGGPFMHLKAYAIDGVLLRTGSANFSTSGENAQDNDLVVIRDAPAAAKFDAHFETMWDGAQPMIEFDPAIRALEPK